MADQQRNEDAKEKTLSEMSAELGEMDEKLCAREEKLGALLSELQQSRDRLEAELLESDSDEKPEHPAMSGQLSEEAIAQMRQLFASFCKDGSGKITAEQMIEGYKSMGAPMGEQEQQEIRKAMLAVDPSGGPISADDYLSRMQMTDSAMETFKMFDKDKSGFLDKSEIMQGMKQLGAEVTEEEAEKMLREADTDGDGKVSYEEFKASFQ